MANQKDTPDLKQLKQSIPDGDTKEAVQAKLDNLVDHERQTDERFTDLADFNRETGCQVKGA